MDEILKLVKECGGYIYPDKQVVLPIAGLNTFYKAAFNAGIEAAAKIVEPSEEHRKDASWGFLGGIEGVELLDGCIEKIRSLEMK